MSWHDFPWLLLHAELSGFSSGYRGVLCSCLKNNNHIEHSILIVYTAHFSCMSWPSRCCSVSDFDIQLRLYHPSCSLRHWLLATLVSFSHSSIKVFILLLHFWPCRHLVLSQSAAMSPGRLTNSSMQNCSNAPPPGWSTCYFTWWHIRPRLIPALCPSTSVPRQKYKTVRCWHLSGARGSSFSLYKVHTLKEEQHLTACNFHEWGFVGGGCTPQ